MSSNGQGYVEFVCIITSGFDASTAISISFSVLIPVDIITVSNNSIRNLYNNLEKCKLINKKITPQILNEISSDIDYKKFEEFTILISDKDKKTTKTRLNNAIKVIYSIYI